MVELVLKRSSGLVGRAPACAPELKLRLSVGGTKKSELNKSSDAVYKEEKKKTNSEMA